MNPVSLFPILPILLLALVTMNLIGKRIHIHQPKGHYTSIDGLRGYLAFFVFLHHSAIWYFFLRFHQWGYPPSRIYSHFGPTSVALFFMITSFLFFSKLINARSGTIDWLKLYVSRIFRIMPLYIVGLSVLFLVIAFLSGFVLHEAPFAIVAECLQWLAFMEPDINGLNGTRLIVAGVVWSLAFEWLLYFSLSFIGLLVFKIKSSYTTIVFTAVFFALLLTVIIQFYSNLALQRLSPFAGGIVAAFLARDGQVRQKAVGKGVSALIIFLFILAVLLSPTFFEPVSYICLVLAFIGIACGNDLFGILSHATSRLLGQISYSIYLLHGLLLFITFRFVIGFPLASTLSPVIHWSIIATCGIFLVVLCSFTYRFIELPCINVAPDMAAWLKSSFRGHKTIRVVH